MKESGRNKLDHNRFETFRMVILLFVVVMAVHLLVSQMATLSYLISEYAVHLNQCILVFL